MKSLHVSIFGKFDARYDDTPIAGLHLTKVQELFCYLLLNRNQPHPREMLASLLWGSYCTTARSKKYLRNALWKLHTALTTSAGPVADRLLETEGDWIQLHAIDELWFDAAVFEDIYRATVDDSGEAINAETARDLDRAVELYTGDVLAGWYQDWCLYERERFLQIYLIMLDKLMGYCQTVREPERGLSYGERILQHDCARERTHRMMMRLYHLAGDRTGALRQYERCATALSEELDVKPARGTVRLYEQIRKDQLEEGPEPGRAKDEPVSNLQAVLDHLLRLENDVSKLRQQVQRAASAAAATLENVPGTRNRVEDNSSG